MDRTSDQTGAVDERDAWGIADGWWDTSGRWCAAEEDVRRELRRRLGADEHPDGPPEGPPTWFVRRGDPAGLWSPGTVELEDGTEVAVDDHLPPDLPLGAHRLRSPGGHVTNLFVVPQRAPAAARSWGWSMQVHATRSAASWGIGDLGDLAAVAAWADERGAGILAHSPLGAVTPVPPLQPSPYYPSSRRFWSPLHLRIESVLGAELAAPLVARAATAGHRLNDDRQIDRDAVWPLKLQALEAIWEQVRDAVEVLDDLAAARHDTGLARHAAFCALAETHGGGFASWPAPLRHPESPAVEAFCAEHVERIDFWRWVHLEADAQLGLAAGSGAPLMADLPVGFDPDGSDAWVDQDLLARGCRIGAPPDDFNQMGQDWGLPPYVPWKLRRDGYRPWLDVLRRTLRHAGALRVDHIMGLFRLFVLPPDARTGHGAYVYQPGADLLELAVMEAARAGAVLVGEDLGTVEPEVRAAMAERGVYGYRVGWFEDGDPSTWPAGSLASLTTHDLPTTVGVWTGADAESRRRAGLPEDPGGDAAVRGRLAALAGVDPGDGADPRQVSVAAHGALARSGSDLALVTLEDAVGEPERPNLPGTVDEHPNWRVALRVPLEELDDAGAGELARVLNASRPEPHG